MLIGLGHDVVTAASMGMAQADATTLLRAAREQGRLFVTRDRDLGALVFLRSFGTGVPYLRMTPSTQRAVEAELQRILELYTEDELRLSFVVVEPRRHRIRKLAAIVTDRPDPAAN